MKRTPRIGASLLALTLMLMLVGTGYAALIYSDSLTVDVPVEEDLYAAGDYAEVRAAIEGDLVVAGRTVSVEALVAMDVIAAAQEVNINAPVGDDIRAAGRSLRFNSDVAGHVVAAGENIQLTANSTVGDWAWLAGREIRVEGQVGRNVRIAGQTVTISGQLGGDVDVYAEHLELTEEARIEGDLAFFSDNEPTIADPASINGEMIHQPAPRDGAPGWLGVIGTVYGLLLITVTVVVGYLLFPGTTAGSAEKLRRAPFKSLGLGLLGLVGTPLAILLLFLTGVGALLGGALLVAYLLWLLLGYIVACVFLASQGLRWAGKYQDASLLLSSVAVLVGVVVLQLLPVIPYLGKLLVFILFLLALGALTRQLWQNYRGAE